MTDKTIWKFAVKLQERFTLELPENFKILKIANGYIWIEGSFTTMRDPKNVGTSRTIMFAIVGTGQSVPRGFQYVGTYFEGVYVWHVYQQIPN